MDKNMRYLYTMKYYSAWKRKKKSVCGNTDGHRRYYTK